MGYMRHNAIVVTSWANDMIEQAHDMAVMLGMSVSNITDTVVNGYRSFLVAPDGSKEGWTASNDGDDRRAKLTDWLDAQRYGDDSTSIDWVEVQFGDERHETKIVRDADEHIRARRYAAEAN